MDAKTFFAAIYAEVPDELFVRVGGLERPEMVTVRELLDGTYKHRRGDAFFSPAAFSALRPVRENVWGSGVAWVDFDGTTTSRPTIPLLPASIVVASGGAGHFHYYWLLDRPVKADVLEGLNRALHNHLGAKGGTWNATRILRVPGTFNMRYIPPAPVEVLRADLDLVYSPEHLTYLQPYDVSILGVPPGKTRSERDWRIACLLVKWGIPEDVIIKALKVLAGDKLAEHRDPDHYLRITVRKAFQVVQKGPDKTDIMVDKVKPIANFWAEPLGKLVDVRGGDGGLLLRLGWDDGETTVAATQRDFESRRSVNSMLSRNGIGTLAWLGSDTDAVNFWSVLSREVANRRFLYVTKEGRFSLDGGGSIFVGSAGTIITPDYDDGEFQCFWETRTSWRIDLTLLPEPPGDVASLMRNVLGVNDPRVVYPLLGWVAAAPLKPLLEDVLGVRFPIMWVYGPRGSGKTCTLQHVFLPLVGVRQPAIGSDVTPFALVAALSATNAIPVWVAEYRPDGRQSNSIQEHLRMNYDGHNVLRGKETQAVQSYSLSAPVVVDSEALPPDSAMRERVFPVMLQQKDLQNLVYRTCYDNVVRSHDEQARFAFQYLRWTLRVDPQAVNRVFTESFGFFRNAVRFDRPARSSAVVWLGLWFVEQFLSASYDIHLPISMEGLRTLVVEAMARIFSQPLGVRTPADDMVELLVHYFTQKLPGFTTGFSWDAENRVLWFNLTTTRAKLARYDRSIPPLDMMEAQLGERVGVYLKGPVLTKLGKMYGVEIDKARDVGLDVPQPDALDVQVLDE